MLDLVGSVAHISGNCEKFCQYLGHEGVYCM